MARFCIRWAVGKMVRGLSVIISKMGDLKNSPEWFAPMEEVATSLFIPAGSFYSLLSMEVGRSPSFLSIHPVNWVNQPSPNMKVDLRLLKVGNNPLIRIGLDFL